MPVEVIMPKVDMDMAAGKVAAWHVAEGATVEKGAPLFDIETDKAAMEVESPASGALHHVRAQIGDEAPVGAPIAWIYAPGEAVGPPPEATAPEARAAQPSAQGTAQERARPSDDAAPTDADRPRATPAARRRARHAGLDLGALIGSGPRGRVQAADVAAAEAAQFAHAAPSRADMEARRLWSPEPGPLHIFDEGDRAAPEPLFMIHGFAADAYAWAAVDAALGPQAARRLRLELPSHGRSPKRRLGDFHALMRESLRAFDASRLERAHLVGHSLGGAVALAIADTRPRAVASLTLIAPAGLGPEIDAALISGVARATRAESLGPWLKRLVGDESIVSEAFIRAAMAARRDPALRAAQQDLAEALFPDGAQAFDLRAALGRVAAPLALVWGRADPVLPWRQALTAPGRAALHLFERLGHTPHIEAPEAVAEVLRRQIAAGGA